MAIRKLKRNSETNIKKADNDTTTVIMNKQDQIREAQEQLDNRTQYLLLDIPMAESTQERVQRIIDTLYHEKHIHDMTKKWLSQTPNAPRLPLFYTLTKIHKPTPVGRPIISGWDGPREQISSFVDCILQPIAKAQKSWHCPTQKISEPNSSHNNNYDQFMHIRSIEVTCFGPRTLTICLAALTAKHTSQRKQT